MADFCRACMPESTDLAGLTTPEDWSKGLAACVLCEGCGAIQVDPAGNCLGDCRPYGTEDTPHVCVHCTYIQIFAGVELDATRRCLFHRVDEYAER